jgi:GntR family transcriptional regulator/MocR family aminotransferase
MTRSRSNSGGAGELFVALRRDLAVPFHKQLETGIRDRIRQGRLRSGMVLPSTRALAADLGLSRGVVVEAYQQLVAEGYLVSRSGGYTQVALDAEAGRRTTAPHAGAAPERPPRIDFR